MIYANFYDMCLPSLGCSDGGQCAGLHAAFRGGGGGDTWPSEPRASADQALSLRSLALMAGINTLLMCIRLVRIRHRSLIRISR